MNGKILLTSFQTWLPDQTSNSSDDLLEEIAKLDISPSLTFLRQLPVDISEASQLAIAKIEELQPNSIICCGMAAKRKKLTVEACATCGYASTRIRLYSYCLSLCRIVRLKKLQNFLPILLAKSNQPDSILLKPSVDLEKLVASLSVTEISHEAGKFVCEGLYYEILKYLRQANSNTSCIFVHVPVLTQENLSDIVADFRLIMQHMANVMLH